MVRPVAGFLRDKFGILLSTFMDDMLTQAKTWKLAMYETHIVCLVFMYCGCSLNWSKTILEPTQTPVHLGFLFNFFEQNKWHSWGQNREIGHMDKVFIGFSCDLAGIARSLVGTMVSVVPACPLAPLHYRACKESCWDL